MQFRHSPRRARVSDMRNDCSSSFIAVAAFFGLLDSKTSMKHQEFPDHVAAHKFRFSALALNHLATYRIA